MFSPDPEQPGHRSGISKRDRFDATSFAFLRHGQCFQVCHSHRVPYAGRDSSRAVHLLFTTPLPGTGSQQGPQSKGKDRGERQIFRRGKLASQGKGCSEQLNEKKKWSHLPEIQMSFPSGAEEQGLMMSFS